MLDLLTERERQIAILIATKALSNKELAREMKLQVGTIKIHVTKVLKKLGLTTRTQIAVDVLKALQDENETRVDGHNIRRLSEATDSDREGRERREGNIGS